MSERHFEVLLSELRVGRLTAREGALAAFRFDRSYYEATDRPVLGQAFEDDLEREYAANAPGRLPGFFANLLPEGVLRRVIETSLEGTAVDDISLLAWLGDDLPGAVRVRPASEDSRTLVRADRGTTDDEHAGEHPGLRFSLAGVQLKFSMLADADRLTLPGHGAHGEWIVKVGTPAYPNMVENELATMEWARACGLEVPECRLYPVEALEGLPRRHAVDGSSVLAIRRFDRADGGRRIHQEDFAQVMALTRPARGNGRFKYGSNVEALAILARTVVGDDAYLDLVRRLAFEIASGNHDAHVKNWSLSYPDGRVPRLSPLYDQLCTVAWPEHDRHLALKLVGTREPAQVDAARLRVLARRVGADESATVGAAMETVRRARETWADAMAPRVPAKAHRRAIAEHWKRVPLLRSVGELVG